MKESVDFNDSHVANGLDKTNATIVNQVEDQFKQQQSKSANDTTVKQPYINWKGEPEEIKTKLPPVKLLDDDMLPEPLAPWLLDISYRMQAPIDFSAAAMFVVFGSVIGAGCKMRPKAVDNWGVVCNLFGMIIGDPSMLKTPAVSEVLKLLDDLQFKYRDIFESEKSEHDFDEMLQEAELKQLQKEIPKLVEAKKIDDIKIAKERYREISENEAPERRLFKTNETSIQSLTVLNKHNERGVLIHVDEIMGLLSQLEMPQNSDMKAYFLTGWNGYGSYTDYKIGRGLTEAKNICLSTLGTTQPQKINSYVHGFKSGGNDGTIQRYQMSVWPDTPKSWKNIDQKPDAEAKQNAYSILEHLAGVDFIELGATQDNPENNSTPYFRFNDAGQIVFNEWLNKLMNVTLKYQDNPLMSQHLSKYRSLMPSIALIIHLIDKADGSTENDGVSESAAKMAVRWCDYLASHARRIYSAAESSDHTAAILLSHKIKSNELPNPFKAHTVYRKGWHGLSDTEEAKAACKVLVEEGWLHEEVPPKPKTGRTPASEYYIHPSLIVDK